jgi:hypothetical protein
VTQQIFILTNMNFIQQFSILNLNRRIYMAKMFQVYGIGQATIPVLPPPVPFETAPTVNQTNYEIGQLVYTPPTSPTAFYLYGGAGNWVQFASSSGDIMAINGTANQVAVATSGGTATVSLPAAITAPGSLTTTTTLASGTTLTAGSSLAVTTTATIGTGLTVTSGNLTLSGTSSKLFVNPANPSTASAGFFSLQGTATTTLSSTAITPNSLLIYSLQALGTVTSSAITYTCTTGSATITPHSSTDTSTYSYVIIN